MTRRNIATFVVVFLVTFALASIFISGIVLLARAR